MVVPGRRRPVRLPLWMMSWRADTLIGLRNGSPSYAQKRRTAGSHGDADRCQETGKNHIETAVRLTCR